jgi:hypothetical protein
VDGYQLKGMTTDMTLDVSPVMDAGNVFGDGWKYSKGVGMSEAALTQSGFFDDSTGSIHDALNEKEAIVRIIGLAFSSNAAGKNFTGMQGAFGSKYSRQIVVGKLHRASAVYSLAGQVDEGVLLQPIATKAAGFDTSGAPVDNGASSLNGGVGYLFMPPPLVLGGFTNVVVKVRHSADGVTWADLITFAAVTVAPNAQRITVAGTVNRYLSAQGTLTGAGAGPSFNVLVGFARL